MSDDDTSTVSAIDRGFDSPRLRWRLIDSRDRDFYRTLYADAAVMAHVGPVLDEAAADAQFDKVLGYNAETPLRARYWRMSDVVSGAPVGLQSMVRATGLQDEYELGMLLLPEWQGQGIGRHATRRICESLFDGRWGFAATSLVARQDPSNARVDRMGEALGFVQFEHPRERNSRWWRITRDAWRAAGAA